MATVLQYLKSLLELRVLYFKACNCHILQGLCYTFYAYTLQEVVPMIHIHIQEVFTAVALSLNNPSQASKDAAVKTCFGSSSSILNSITTHLQILLTPQQ